MLSYYYHYKYPHHYTVVNIGKLKKLQKLFSDAANSIPMHIVDRCKKGKKNFSKAKTFKLSL